MFTVHHTDGDARSGTLHLPSGTSISTPATLIYTRRGGAVNLTPDLLQTMQPDAQAIQLNMVQLLTLPATLESFQGTAKEFLAIDPSLSTFLTSRDPCVYEFLGPLRQSTDDAAAISAPGGATLITPEQYMDCITALGPDAAVLLSDEIPSYAKRARAASSVHRTLAWLKRSLQVVQAANPLAAPALFAAIQGGNELEFRERCAEGVAAELPQLAGVCVSGLGTGESPEQRSAIISVVLKHIPSDKARIISSVSCPQEVIEAVAQGIDIFDGSYVADVTAGGYALNFPLDVSSEEEESALPIDADAAAVAGTDDTKMNLWAAAYRTDARPLVPGCSCLACTSHTRAYIHHLLHVHEMTAQVLLEAHNTAHYLKFFGAMRAAVAEGRFEAYREGMAARKQRWLVAVGAVAED